jgi:hypothetical protein
LWSGRLSPGPVVTGPTTIISRIWLVDSLEFMMMHGLAKRKSICFN